MKSGKCRGTTPKLILQPVLPGRPVPGTTLCTRPKHLLITPQYSQNESGVTPCVSDCTWLIDGFVRSLGPAGQFVREASSDFEDELFTDEQINTGSKKETCTKSAHHENDRAFDSDGPEEITPSPKDTEDQPFKDRLYTYPFPPDTESRTQKIMNMSEMKARQRTNYRENVNQDGLLFLPEIVSTKQVPCRTNVDNWQKCAGMPTRKLRTTRRMEAECPKMPKEVWQSPPPPAFRNHCEQCPSVNTSASKTCDRCTSTHDVKTRSPTRQQSCRCKGNQKSHQTCKEEIILEGKQYSSFRSLHEPHVAEDQTSAMSRTSSTCAISGDPHVLYRAGDCIRDKFDTNQSLMRCVSAPVIKLDHDAFIFSCASSDPQCGSLDKHLSGNHGKKKNSLMPCTGTFKKCTLKCTHVHF